MTNDTKLRNRGVAGKIVPKLLYLAVVLALALFGGYYYKKYHDLQHRSPDQLAQSQQDKVVAEIGKLYKLPKDEKPQYATVKDKESLRKQNTFFAQAENDDVVLIYAKAQLAIIYRPSTKQLVKVGPVNIQATVSVKVIGKQADREAVEKMLTANQVTATDAGDTKGSYVGTTVVDVSGKNADQAKKAAEILGGQVGTMPAGEDTPAGADIVIVAGSVSP